MDKWDKRFIKIAKEVSLWSKDPRSKIGAIAVKDKKVIATGYNGFPKGVEDTQQRLYDRPTKHMFVVHAEANCIYNAVEHGVSLKGSTFYVHGLPVCNECAKGVIQSGVKNVVINLDSEPQEKWKDLWQTTKIMFDECNINYVTYLHDERISI